MPAINQRIPNFNGGVSQQPDFLKFSGQLRTCHNAHPDVTFGLQKRPPGEYVCKLNNAIDDGQWFDIIRDDDEKYLVHVKTTGTPDIKVWALTDLPTGSHPAGTQLTVLHGTNATGNFSYLAGATDPLGKLTINDYTIITNPQKTVTTARTTTARPHANFAFINLNEIAYNTEYVVALGSSNLGSGVTKYRAEALSVVKQGTTSSTWETSSSSGQYTGKETYFGQSTDGSWEDVQFTVAVNATHFVKDYTTHNEGASNQYSTANYDTQYTATVVLQDPGKNVVLNATKDITVNGQTYTVKITKVSSYISYSDANAAVYETPRNIKKGEITVDSVLGNLKAKIEAKYTNATATICGSGLYISSTSAFTNVATRGGLTGDAMYAFTDTIQNISKLPSQCRNGYVVKISNTEDSGADDYYVKFITGGSGDFGAGVWEETVAPGITAGFNYTTMPHALINNRNGTFTWTTLDPDVNHPTNSGAWAGDDITNYWVDRTVGDDNTNPMPTFVGQGISALFFIRNRLGLISGEQVVISQPADYFNFFVGSAISTSDSDVIDMAASDVKPAIIRHVIPMQKGVMMFTEAAQFMLFTESEQFSPKTAQIKKMASYDSSRNLIPVDTGTAVVFATNNSSYAKVFELIVTTTDAPPRVVEQTRVVPEFIPKDIDDICNSATENLITLGKIGDSTVYMYKYFDQGNQRVLTSWYSWEIEGALVHQLYTGGNYWTVTKQGSEWIVQRYELIVDSQSGRNYTVGTGTVGSPTSIARQFEACLDNMVDRSQTTEAYNATTKKTTITYPYTIQNGTTNLRLVELADGNVRTPSSVSGATAVYDDVDLRAIDFATGYKYTMEVGLPTYYYKVDGAERGVYDVDADLRIHRLNFELGISGPMEFHLTSPQMADHIQYESGLINDISTLNKVPSQLYKHVSVPIYRKNSKYDMTVKITAPFTATLVSASWDGKYNSRRHVRR